MAIGNLNFKITAFDLTKKAFRGIQKSLSLTTRALTSFKTQIIAVAGAAGLGLLVKSSLDSIDRISKLSRTLGISVKDLRKLQLAADLSGVQLETLARGVRTLNKGMIDFIREGTGEAQDAFHALGISAEELNQVAGDQFKVLELVADRLDDVGNSAERSAIAQQLFGGRASELLLVLEEGSEGLARIAKEAQDFGLILSTATARNVEEANDAFTRLSSLFIGLRDTVVGALAPAFQKLADVIRTKVLDSIAEAGGIEQFGRSLAISIISIFEKAFFAVLRFTNGVIRQLNRVIQFASDVGQALGSDFLKNLKTLERLEFREVGNFFQTLKDSIDEINPAAELLNNNLSDTDDKITDAKNSLEEFRDAAKDVQKSMQDVALSGVKSLEDALVNVSMRTQSVKDAFKSMASSIISDIIRMQIRQGISAPLAGMLGKMPIFGGSAANGGSVRAGAPYMVGERGPEMFVPSQSGRIVSNEGLGVTVNQTINLSAGVSQTVRAEVMNMLPQIEQAAKGAVLDAKRRGGSFAKYV